MVLTLMLYTITCYLGFYTFRQKWGCNWDESDQSLVGLGFVCAPIVIPVFALALLPLVLLFLGASCVLAIYNLEEFFYKIGKWVDE